MSRIGKLIAKHSSDAIVLIEQLLDLAGPEGIAAHQAIEVIRGIVTAVREGQDKKIDPSEVQRRIDATLATLEDKIAQNRAAALDAADKKFPPQPDPLPPPPKTDPSPPSPADQTSVDAKFPPGE